MKEPRTGAVLSPPGDTTWRSFLANGPGIAGMTASVSESFAGSFTDTHGPDRPSGRFRPDCRRPRESSLQ